MKEYNAIIEYTIKKTHPDIKAIKNWKNNKIFKIKDIYSFFNSWDEAQIIKYIKNDLSLVAGGGYTIKHINILNVFIKRIK